MSVPRAKHGIFPVISIYETFIFFSFYKVGVHL